jgi:hypothetical protein
MDMIFDTLKLLTILYVLTDLGLFLSDLIPVPKTKWLALPILFLKYVLGCSKCFSFWFTLIYTGDLFMAAWIGIAVNLIKELEYKYNKGKTLL